LTRADFARAATLAGVLLLRIAPAEKM